MNLSVCDAKQRGVSRVIADLPRAGGMGRILSAASLLPLLGGCAAYLHNPERETATAAVKTGFDALAAPAFFDAQEKNLTDLAAREDRALAELLVTSRNYRMLNVISPASNAEKKTT